ncbi:hypothetical protein CEXT_138631 [Caerostris extrusa]|uniref:Uncharacterized protein n=1 Tax=Caerostris extrusa TaxID=172846 RepID=A0AAV4Y7P4_CAEEX|nr:hypothetical protein CEXT_138631 [Caerostris extrusa]
MKCAPDCLVMTGEFSFPEISGIVNGRAKNISGLLPALMWGAERQELHDFVRVNMENMERVYWKGKYMNLKEEYP